MRCVTTHLVVDSYLDVRGRNVQNQKLKQEMQVDENLGENCDSKV